MNTPKILLGALAGLAAGVVIGMLIAPEKGSTLRKNILKKGDDLADEIGEKIEEKFEGVVNRISGKFMKKKDNDVLPSRKQEVEV
jgi:gas vesicle protein